MLESRYWEEEERRKCRICGGEEESWEHVWERCRVGRVRERGWQEVVKEILGEGGEGEWWMKEIEEERKRKNSREELGDESREEGGWMEG